MDVSRTLDGHLDSIQVCRAIAAVAVVFTHAITRISTTFGESHPASVFYRDGRQWTVGDAGVDLFFAISGFIMLYVHRNDFGRAGVQLNFISKRLLRVVPIYWLVTTMSVAIMFLLPSLFTTHSTSIDVPWIIGSYLFLPITSPDGVISPIVGVGWTLNYEMFFYLIFTFALALPLKRALPLIFLFFCALVLIGVLWPAAGPIFTFATSWLLLDFLMGIAIAWWALRWGKPPMSVSIFLIGIGTAALAITVVHTPPEQGALRFLAWGVPCALILFGACGTKDPSGKAGRIASAVGNASYSIYLFQALAMPFWAIVMRKAQLDILSFDLRVLLLTLLVTVSGVLFWYFVERPLGRIVKGYFATLRARNVSSSA